MAPGVPPNQLLGLLLGLDLDDEVHVVPDSTQIGLHAEIRAFESTAGGKTCRVAILSRGFANFVYDDVECNRLGHAM